MGDTDAKDLDIVDITLIQLLCNAGDQLQDKVNGTQRPDLGPKFYIARPHLVREGAKCRYRGVTFTPLHCDLADAVNFSCSGEQATWHMFHRDDRQSECQAAQKF